MAEIIPHGSRKPRDTREHGSSGVLETIIASQKEGCNRISVRALTLRKGGHSPLRDTAAETVYMVLEGILLLVDGDGFLHNLSAGDTVIIRPHEKHILRNETDDVTRVLAVSSV
jgi:quercetin dioxygenase-like cupin family protein